MARLIYALGVLLLAGIACGQQECNPSEIMTCFKPFENLHFDVAHAIDVAQLTTMCKDWSLARPCLQKFIGGQCQGFLPDQLVSSLRALENVADYICKDALNEIIAEHECFFNSHAEAATCVEHLGIDATQASNPQQLMTSLVQTGGCLRLSRYEECVISTLRTSCSAKASLVIRHVYDLINREVEMTLQCDTPILSPIPPVETDRILPPEPPIGGILPPRLPETPLRGEDLNCHAMHECMRHHHIEKHSSDKCRMLELMEHCLRRAEARCTHSHHIIQEMLMKIRAEEHEHQCESAETEHSRHEGGSDSHRHRHHLGRKMKIGIAVGVAAVVVVLATVLVAVCHVKRRRAQRLDKAQLIDKETYNSNLSVAVEGFNKDEKKVLA